MIAPVGTATTPCSVAAGWDLELDSVVAAERKATQDNSATARAGKRNMQSLQQTYIDCPEHRGRNLRLARKKFRTAILLGAVRGSFFALSAFCFGSSLFVVFRWCFCRCLV